VPINSPLSREAISQDPSDPVFMLEQIRAGVPGSWTRFCNLFQAIVLRDTRRHLSDTLRRRFDSTDVTQMVWMDFVNSVTGGKQFQTPAQVRAFLQTLVCNNVMTLHHEHIETQKRSLSREQPLDESADRHLGPSEQAEVNDEMEQLLSGCSARERAMLLALHNGDRLDEIAGRLGVSVKTIRRWLHSIAQRDQAG
jgi:RNA polymerase sigma factor (sigma-70 family)